MSEPTPAPRTARERARVELTREILASAGRQLVEVGPAALSLRAVARDLGMASSAVYRYVESRDALLTLLLVEGYEDLAAALEASQEPLAEDDVSGRFRALGRALRDWAHAQPHRWALLYGSPVPGYVAPADTVGPATRVVAPFLETLAAAQARPDAAVPPALDDDLAASLAPVSHAVQPPLLPGRTADGLGTWSALVGAVSLELFGHFNNAVLDPQAWFEHLLGRLEESFGR
ncbi:TetR/AcrR family transcriptional regulator [Nocardioides bruguierae]|uniref:TetR/AcrR family transcriptional regulator n=1 Tax=Nocardioides bruguierae TaxID=2945102 RepID=A0A9X2D9M2_9ACTN|nr:TetR/AcrR family transcriptional regulator [Nocardioides bruguierae]MCM0621695.1 TetR/AcrR family transcriptional regulator [Nocardioides bruguierae]